MFCLDAGLQVPARQAFGLRRALQVRQAHAHHAGVQAVTRLARQQHDVAGVVELARQARAVQQRQGGQGVGVGSASAT